MTLAVFTEIEAGVYILMNFINVIPLLSSHERLLRGEVWREDETFLGNFPLFSFCLNQGNRKLFWE